jgi:hypothetical protein
MTMVYLHNPEFNSPVPDQISTSSTNIPRASPVEADRLPWKKTIADFKKINTKDSSGITTEQALDMRHTMIRARAHSKVQTLLSSWSLSQFNDFRGV